MTNRPNRKGGFTLVEVIVVIAVILLLTGIAVPMIGGYIADGRKARARADVKAIATGLFAFYKDVASWPTRNANGRINRVRVLYTGEKLPLDNPFLVEHSWNSWALDGEHGDVLDNHLLNNEPQGSADSRYTTKGERAWHGPYLSGPMGEDPWGRPYVIFLYSGFSTSTVNYKRIYVLSAGEDGELDTDPMATSKTPVSDDDIGLIIYQRT